MAMGFHTREHLDDLSQSVMWTTFTVFQMTYFRRLAPLILEKKVPCKVVLPSVEPFVSLVNMGDQKNE